MPRGPYRGWPPVLVAGLAVLVTASFASLAIGSRAVPLGEVLPALLHPDDSWAAVVVREQRLPRTLLAVTVGAALGIAGALMQSLTRNPLADPGILGVNAGAGLAVVLAVAVFGVVGIWFYLWFAFAGAALAAVAVHLLGGAAGPARIALGGIAISAAAGSLVQTVILADQQAFNEFRFWAAGSLEGRRWAVLAAVAPFVGAGVLLVAVLAPALNALALGEDTAGALGVRAGRVLAGSMLAVTLLCGAATAAVGPVGFVGLGAPYLVRALVGPDLRRVIGASLLYAPALVLLADVLGRRLVPGSEIPVGIVTAVLGGPVFVLLVRRPRIAAL